MENKMPTITSFEGARIIFTNFRGESHPKYNARGARSFHIALEDPDLAQELVEEGYNVRFPKPNDEIDPEKDRRVPSLEVTVSSDHDYIKPGVKIFLVDDDDSVVRINTKNLDQVDRLDTLDIGRCDIAINPYRWVMDAGKPYETSGIKAYLTTIYITLDSFNDDPFAHKYESQ